MEAASEKRRRGRPRAHPSLADMPAGLFTSASGRARNNYMFAIEAMDVIGCEATPEFSPTPFPLLVDWRAGSQRKRGAIKFGVLTELGRAAREFEPGIVRMMAERISEALADGRINTAREAELQVREWRAALQKRQKTG